MGIAGKLLGILFLIAAGFVWGYHMGTTSEATAPIVTVKMVNASGKIISALRLMHDEGSVDVSNMPDGASHTARFLAPKETSYHIEVTFDDGRMVESDKRFVERGLVATETIKETEIQPDFKVNAQQIVN